MDTALYKNLPVYISLTLDEVSLSKPTTVNVVHMKNENVDKVLL